MAQVVTVPLSEAKKPERTQALGSAATSGPSHALDLPTASRPRLFTSGLGRCSSAFPRTVSHLTIPGGEQGHLAFGPLCE